MDVLKNKIFANRFFVKSYNHSASCKYIYFCHYFLIGHMNLLKFKLIIAIKAYFTCLLVLLLV